MSEDLSVHVISHLDGFKDLASDWTGLLSRSTSRDIFLTWEWQYQWTKVFLGDNRLRILLFLDRHQRVRGIAPFYIRPRGNYILTRCREVAFLGTEEVCPGYLDVLAEPAYQRKVWHRLYRFLFQEAADDWDILTLERIPAESSGIDALMELFQEAGKVVEVLEPAACPTIRLPRLREDLTRTWSANRRYTVQRKQRALARAGFARYRHIDKGPDVPVAFDAIVELHEKRWMAKGESGAFTRPRFAAFHRALVPVLAEKGWLSLSLLTLDDRPLAGIYGFVYENRYYFYLSGFDPDIAPHASPGMLLLARRIEQAIDEGLDRIDLLHGDVEYKRRWATDIRRTLTIRAYNRSARSGCAKFLDGMKQAIKVAVR